MTDLKNKNYVWSSTNLAEVMPGVHMPLVNELVLGCVGTILGQLIEGFTSIRVYPEMPLLMPIHGRPYFNLTLLEDFLKEMIGSEQISIVEMLGGEQETLGKTIKLSWYKKARLVCKMIVWSAQHLLLIPVRMWKRYTGVKKTQALSEMLLSSQEYTNMQPHFDLLLNAFLEILSSIMWSLFLPMSLYFFYRGTCTLWIKDKGATKNVLLSDGGEGFGSVDAFVALWEIATLVRKEQGLSEKIIQLQSTDAVLTLFNNYPEINGRFQQFLAIHGHRCAMEIDFSLPRWRDDPTFIIDVIKKYLLMPEEESPLHRRTILQQQHLEVKRKLRDSLSWWKYCILTTLLAWARKAQLKREEAKSEFIAYLYLLRKVVLHIGSLLAKNNYLLTVEDIFFLTRAEISSILLTKIECDSVNTIVVEREKQFLDDSSKELPGVIYDLENIPSVQRTDAFSGVKILLGTGVSHGVYEGVARVLYSAAEIGRVNQGEILVTDHTDPGWTPIFPVIKGMVTNTGGMLSHAAIIAREYGLPAVVNVRNATQILIDGKRIRINGDSGEVEILED